MHSTSRSPHRIDPASAMLDDAQRFAVLACLTYGADDPARVAQARLLLDERPHLVNASLWCAAAAGDPRAVRERVAAGDAVDAEGGPFQWVPLLYAAFSRLEGGDPYATVETLLEAGADANAGFLWDGLVPPFTALTGVLGGGEGSQPQQHDALRTARLLLDAGADPNDAQAVYNHGLGGPHTDDTDVLALLCAHGLGRGDGGPWRRALAPRQPSPTQLLTEALQHAAEHGLLARVRLLLAQGADPNSRATHPLFGGRSVYQGAVAQGEREVCALLEAGGADRSSPSDAQRLAGAYLSGDDEAVQAARVDSGKGVASAPPPELLATAASRGRDHAVHLLLRDGADVGAPARTPLHEAAFAGHASTVELLLTAGADPCALDPEFSATPSGWARHGGHDALADRLERAEAAATQR